VLVRLAYLGVTNTLALLRLLPISARDKDAEILALRHQITVVERQLHGERFRFTWADRAWLAALLCRLPRDVLRSLRSSCRRQRGRLWSQWSWAGGDPKFVRLEVALVTPRKDPWLRHHRSVESECCDQEGAAD
jgi:hypothetical protein